MTILEALQEANTDAGITTPLSFANLREFNSFKHSFEYEDYPINVVVPFELEGVFKNNRAKENVPLQGWILTRIPQDTNDYRSAAIEDTYINPMRVLAKKFLRNLLDTDIIDSEVEDVRYRILPEYMFLDSHLFGVSYQCSVPVHDNACR
jgi:hypothetical protein